MKSMKVMLFYVERVILKIIENDIAYLLAIFKNGQHMWDQDIRTKAGGEPEKKEEGEAAILNWGW